MESALPVVLVIVKVLLVIVAVLTFVAYLTLIERKVLGWIQVRIGPNRVGPWGLLQPLADGAKLLLKEGITVSGANRIIYLAAPLIVVACAIIPYELIPFARGRGWEHIL